MIREKNVTKKIIFLFLSYLWLVFGVIIKKQLKIAIIGIKNGLKKRLNISCLISGIIESVHLKVSGLIIFKFLS